MEQSSVFDNRMDKDDFKISHEIRTGHSRSINMVRFSRFGTFIGSCSDDCNVIVWERKMRPVVFGKPELKLTWGERKILRWADQWAQTGDLLDSVGSQ